eukprot:8382334-Ditylum_brightwellii.AAC.1
MLFILVPDKEQFQENVKQTIANYKADNNNEMKKIIAFLYQYLVSDNNKLTKFLQHRRVVCFEEVNRLLLEHHKQHFSEGLLAQVLKKGTTDID